MQIVNFLRLKLQSFDVCSISGLSRLESTYLLTRLTVFQEITTRVPKMYDSRPEQKDMETKKLGVVVPTDVEFKNPARIPVFCNLVEVNFPLHMTFSCYTAILYSCQIP